MSERFRPPEDVVPQESHEARPETDAEKIKRDFETLPSEQVRLFANNMARPDGFVKTLVTGKLVTSAENMSRLDPKFTRTHRGYYKRWPRDTSILDANDYLCFSVGKPHLMYAASSGASNRNENEFEGGIGFSFPANDLLARDGAKTAWGLLYTPRSLKKVDGTPLMEPRFEHLRGKTDNWRDEDEFWPPKEDLLNLVHLARKAGMLSGGDQAEVQLHGQGGEKAQLELTRGIILIPEKSREAFMRLLRLKLKEMAPHRDEIKKVFEVDVATLTPEAVIADRKNIYWYPQKNASLAVQYLSTHPETADALLAGTGH